MNCCKQPENIELLREYDPRPANRDGSISWYLYRWDDGKDGCRSLRQCRSCGRFYLVQAYHLNKFSPLKDRLFEDWYPVTDPRQADHWNRHYTGIQLEHRCQPAFQTVQQAGEDTK